MLGQAEGNGSAPIALVVEDDPAQRELLCEILRYEGFAFLACASVGEASKLIAAEEFSVAILDLRLPDGPGTKVLKQIRAHDDTVQVIMHTAHGSYASAKDAVNLGACAYLEKLGDPNDLVRQIHRAARESRRRVQANAEEGYRDLAESAPVGILRADDAGLVVYVNRSWRRLSGLTAEQSLGEGWLRGLHRDDRERVLAQWHQALAAGETFSQEFRLARGDDTMVAVLGHAGPVRDGERVTGYVGTVTALGGASPADRAGD